MWATCAAQVKRGTKLHRDTALAAAAAYQHMYCDDEEGDSIAATYQASRTSGHILLWPH
jgi:hypothetical protein